MSASLADLVASEFRRHGIGVEEPSEAVDQQQGSLAAAQVAAAQDYIQSLNRPSARSRQPEPRPESRPVRQGLSDLAQGAMALGGSTIEGLLPDVEPTGIDRQERQGARAQRMLGSDDITPDDTGVFEDFRRGVGMGLSGVAQGLLGTAAMTAQDEGRRERMLQTYDDISANTAENAMSVPEFTGIVQRDEDTGRIEVGESLRRAGRWAVGQAGAMIPIVGSIMAMGAAGAGIGKWLGPKGAAVGGALGLGRGAIGAALGRYGAAKVGAVAGSTVGSFAAGYSLYAGSLYGDITAQGGEHEEARAAALKYAAPAAAVSIVLPMGATAAIAGYLGRDFVKDRTRNMLAGAGIGMMTEGAAEAIAESFVVQGEMSVLGDDLYTPEEIRNRIINATAGGGVMGVGTGAMAGIGQAGGDIDTLIDSIYDQTQEVAEQTRNNQAIREYYAEMLGRMPERSEQQDAVLAFLTDNTATANRPLNREMAAMQQMAVEVVKRDDSLNVTRAQLLAEKAQEGALSGNEALELTAILANSKPGDGQDAAQSARKQKTQELLDKAGVSRLTDRIEGLNAARLRNTEAEQRAAAAEQRRGETWDVNDPRNFASEIQGDETFAEGDVLIWGNEWMDVVADNGNYVTLDGGEWLMNVKKSDLRGWQRLDGDAQERLYRAVYAAQRGDRALPNPNAGAPINAEFEDSTKRLTHEDHKQLRYTPRERIEGLSKFRQREDRNKEVWDANDPRHFAVTLKGNEKLAENDAVLWGDDILRVVADKGDSVVLDFMGKSKTPGAQPESRFRFLQVAKSDLNGKGWLDVATQESLMRRIAESQRTDRALPNKAESESGIRYRDESTSSRTDRALPNKAESESGIRYRDELTSSRKTFANEKSAQQAIKNRGLTESHNPFQVNSGGWVLRPKNTTQIRFAAKEGREGKDSRWEETQPQRNTIILRHEHDDTQKLIGFVEVLEKRSALNDTQNITLDAYYELLNQRAVQKDTLAQQFMEDRQQPSTPSSADTTTTEPPSQQQPTEQPTEQPPTTDNQNRNLAAVKKAQDDAYQSYIEGSDRSRQWFEDEVQKTPLPDWTTVTNNEGESIRVLRSGDHRLVAVPRTKSEKSFDIIDLNDRADALETGVSIQDVYKKLWSIARADRDTQELAAEQGEQPPNTGNRSRAAIPGEGSVDVDLALVDASDLITSHDSAGNRNPNYPSSIQPRDRGRDSSQAQIAQIAAKLDPELLGDTKMVERGAPIIGGDNAVESGNARTLALQRAYRQHPERAEAYKQWLRDNADEFGLTAEQIDQMDNPVLVRRRVGEMTEAERKKFAADANRRDTLEMSPLETAKSDAELISDRVLALYNPDKDGNVLAAQNDRFLQAFATAIGKNEAAKFRDADGRWNKQMVERVENAVFARAYGDDTLIGLKSEVADNNIRNIINALNVAAGEFAKLPRTDESMDIVAPLVQAINLVRSNRGAGELETALDSSDMFAADGDSQFIPDDVALLARHINANMRSAARLGESFKTLARAVQRETSNNERLFGDSLSRTDIISRTTTGGGTDGQLDFTQTTGRGDTSGQPPQGGRTQTEDAATATQEGQSTEQQPTPNQFKEQLEQEQAEARQKVRDERNSDKYKDVIRINPNGRATKASLRKLNLVLDDVTATRPGNTGSKWQIGADGKLMTLADTRQAMLDTINQRLAEPNGAVLLSVLDGVDGFSLVRRPGAGDARIQKSPPPSEPVTQQPTTATPPKTDVSQFKKGDKVQVSDGTTGWVKSISKDGQWVTVRKTPEGSDVEIQSGYKISDVTITKPEDAEGSTAPQSTTSNTVDQKGAQTPQTTGSFTNWQDAAQKTGGDITQVKQGIFGTSDIVNRDSLPEPNERLVEVFKKHNAPPMEVRLVDAGNFKRSVAGGGEVVATAIEAGVGEFGAMFAPKEGDMTLWQYLAGEDALAPTEAMTVPQRDKVYADSGDIKIDEYVKPRIVGFNQIKGIPDTTNADLVNAVNELGDVPPQVVRLMWDGGHVDGSPTYTIIKGAEWVAAAREAQEGKGTGSIETIAITPNGLPKKDQIPIVQQAAKLYDAMLNDLNDPQSAAQPTPTQSTNSSTLEAGVKSGRVEIVAPTDRLKSESVTNEPAASQAPSKPAVPRQDRNGQPTKSWVVVDKSTGQSVRELQSHSMAEKVNREQYDVVPANDYLQDLNASLNDAATSTPTATTQETEQQRKLREYEERQEATLRGSEESNQRVQSMRRLIKKTYNSEEPANDLLKWYAAKSLPEIAELELPWVITPKNRHQKTFKDSAAGLRAAKAAAEKAAKETGNRYGVITIFDKQKIPQGYVAARLPQGDDRQIARLAMFDAFGDDSVLGGWSSGTEFRVRVEYEFDPPASRAPATPQAPAADTPLKLKPNNNNKVTARELRDFLKKHSGINPSAVSLRGTHDYGKVMAVTLGAKDSATDHAEQASAFHPILSSVAGQIPNANAVMILANGATLSVYEGGAGFIEGSGLTAGIKVSGLFSNQQPTTPTPQAPSTSSATAQPPKDQAEQVRDFGQQVQQIVDEMPVHPLSRDSVAISELYDEYAKTHQDIGSLEDFKIWLLHAQAGRHIEMRSFDDPNTLPEIRSKSEIKHGENRFHLVKRTGNRFSPPPQFARRAATQAQPKTTVQAVWDALGLSNRDANKLRASGKLNVVQSVSDLGVSAPEDVSGMFLDGQMWLVADNLPSSEVRPIILHESVHSALQDLRDTPAFGQILDTVDRLRQQTNSPFAKAEALLRKRDPEIAAAYDKNPTGRNRERFLDEVLAYATQTPEGRKTSPVHRLMALIRNALRRLGLVNTFSENDLMQIAPIALRRMARGQTMVQEYRGMGEPLYHKVVHGTPHKWKPEPGMQPKFARTGEKTTGDGERNLYVAHNISAAGLRFADDMGGLAAPSLAVARADKGFENFGEITLLANPEVLNDPKARTHDADIYTTRQPRAEHSINRERWVEFNDRLSNEYGLNPPGQADLTDGPDNLLYNKAAQYAYLQETGKAPRTYKAQAAPEIMRAAKEQGQLWEMKDNPKVQRAAKAFYEKNIEQQRQYLTRRKEAKKGTEQIDVDAEIQEVRAEFFDENGELNRNLFADFVHKAIKYRDQGGVDTARLQRDIDKKMGAAATQRGYEQWVTEQFNRLVDGKKLFKGYTASGTRKYAPYTLENVVKEMTRKIQGGEDFTYGAASIRAMYAGRMKNVAQVQRKRDRIISEKDFEAISKESRERLNTLLDELRPHYRFDANSHRYIDDAASAIGEGPRGWAEAFDLTPEIRQKITDFTQYLSELPTTYFESKMTRAMNFNEFSIAVVPRNIDKQALGILKKHGLRIKYYDSKTSRAEVISRQNEMLFNRDGSDTQPKTTAQAVWDALGLSKRESDGLRASGKLNIVQSVSELGVSAPPDVSGMFLDGQMWLVADNLPASEGRPIILHESVHSALQDLRGTPAFDQILDTVDRLRKQTNSPFAKAEALLRKRDPDVASAYDNNPTGRNRERFLDEVLAYATQTPEGRKTSPVRRLMALIRNALRRLGLVNTFSENDLMQIAPIALRRMARGQTMVQEYRGMGEPLYHRLFHGTPHTWQAEPGFPQGRPRLDFIGSGEGNTAYGWGWYGAESEAAGRFYQQLESGVAKDLTRVTLDGKDFAYRDQGTALSKALVSKGASKAAADNAVKALQEHGELDLALNSQDPFFIEIEAMREGTEVSEQALSLAEETTEALSMLEQPDVEGSGNLYTLDMPDSALPTLLDWDTPINQQTPEVQQALNAVLDQQGITLKKTATGEQAYNAIVEAKRNEEAAVDAKKQASLVLRDAGIPGLRYKDGSSRTAEGEPTRNVVIWNQDVLDKSAITARNDEQFARSGRRKDTQTADLFSKPLQPIKESVSAKRGRENSGFELLRVDAEALQRLYEADNKEPLAWKPDRLDTLRQEDVWDEYPTVGASEYTGHLLGIDNGRHRIAVAAERGLSIEIQVPPEHRAAIERKLAEQSLSPPDADDQYMDAVKRGDMDTAQRLVLEKAEASGLPVIKEDGVTAYRVRREAPPKKTAKAYKLFRAKKTKQGEVFALFVGATDPLPQGAWLDAIAGPQAPASKTGKQKVKSKLGPLAYRPGWHAGDLPLATHIGAKDTDGNVFARKDDEVWAEVEMAHDKDYQAEAEANGTRPDGTFVVGDADIKKMPVDGLYRYKTNPNMTGKWIISGSMKINRILSQDEVNTILKNADQKTMPWASLPRGSKVWQEDRLNLSKWGLDTNPARNQKKLLDPVTYDDNGNVIPLSDRFDADKPDPRFARGASVTAQEQQAQEQVQSISQRIKVPKLDIKDRISQASAQVRPFIYKLLTRQQLTEISHDVDNSDAPGTFGGMANEFERMARQMDTDAHSAITENVELGKRWAKLSSRWFGNRDAATEMGAIMHDSTRAGVDPSKALPDNASPEETKAYQELRQRWNALEKKSPEAAQLYKDVRNAYKKQRTELFKALARRIANVKPTETMPTDFDAFMRDILARIENSDGAHPKREMLGALRERFELTGRVKGVYFPLSRFGDYYVRTTRDGEETFSLFETPRQQEAAIQDLKAQGYKDSEIAAGKQVKNLRPQDGPGQAFMGNIVGKIDEAGLDAKTAEALKDELWQAYLRTLPEASIRRNSIHRKGTLGYSEDALRAFAHQTTHSAKQIARLKAAHSLGDLLMDMSKYSSELGKRGATRKANMAADITTALNSSYDWMMNPTTNKVAVRLNQLGFAWYLGVSPAAALVNMTQVPIVALPMLSAHFGDNPARGAFRASKALGRAFKTYGRITASKKAKEKFDQTDEGKMLKYLEDTGIIDRTQAMSLIGMDDSVQAQFKMGADKIMAGIGWFYHQAEVANRTVTALAAYQLARQKGMSPARATDEAYTLASRSQFDYSSSNRAEFVRGNVARVVFLFQQYSQNIAFRMTRDLLRSFKPGEQRQQAATQLVGILGMTGLFAGAMGLPLMNTILTAIQTAYDLSSDDDDPEWDARLAFRQTLAELPGGDVMAKGVLNKLTPADLATRTSLSYLFVRPPDRDLGNQQLAGYYLEQAAGPVAGIGVNAARGLDLVARGELQRGVELMVPKFIRDGMRATRFSEEGALNLRGDPVMEDFTPAEIVSQFMGFTPARLAEKYEQNSALARLESKVLNRRRSLMNGYYMAWRNNDREGMAEINRKIAGFNRAHPEVVIRQANIRDSIRTRLRYSERAENGMSYDPRLQVWLVDKQYLQ